MRFLLSLVILAAPLASFAEATCPQRYRAAATCALQESETSGETVNESILHAFATDDIVVCVPGRALIYPVDTKVKIVLGAQNEGSYDQYVLDGVASKAQDGTLTAVFTLKEEPVNYQLVAKGEDSVLTITLQGVEVQDRYNCK